MMTTLYRNKPFIFLLMAAGCLLGKVPPLRAQQAHSAETDVCIYSGTAAGVIAAYTAAMQGKRVLLIEPTHHLGGMTSGGLGFTDIGNKYVVTGLARDFYRRIGEHYGKFEQWIFEPHAAEDVFKRYIQKANVQVWYGCRLRDVAKNKDGWITGITVERASPSGPSAGRVIRAKEFMDCSYEGDLMAKAGVRYTTGREANSQYKETYNGVELMNGHQFPDGIDPYKVPGKPASGLLWGISQEPLAPAGSADKKIQAYNYRVCLTNDPANRIPIVRPERYDSSHYDLLVRYMEHKPWSSIWGGLTVSPMPNHKTDINNNGPFSTDMIGMNYDYPDAGYAARQAIIQAHEDYTRGLLYFLGHDPRVPENIRVYMSQWGYPKDEYTDNDHWTFQLYVREARRMVGDYVMTQANCQGKEIVSDGIGMAAYTMDSHNCQRIVVNGMVKNEGNVEIGGFGPYPISYRSIVPKASEAKNLYVPVCLSASHIAYGSIRMEPVFMVLGQAAATAACMAIDKKVPVQEVPVGQLQQELKTNPLADGSTPEILTDDADQNCTLVRGHWQTGKYGGYGPSFLMDTPGVPATPDSNKTASGNAAGSQAIAGSVRFTPAVTRSGSYSVYSYLPKVKNAATQTTITIFDGQNTVRKTIRPADLRVEGQTSGEWVSLGTYTLEAGTKAYAEISDKGADGVVVADAILWVPREK